MSILQLRITGIHNGGSSLVDGTSVYHKGEPREKVPDELITANDVLIKYPINQNLIREIIDAGGDVDQSSEPIAIDNNKDAFNHYMNGNGEAVNLGPNTVSLLLNSKDFKYRHNRIITGKTTSLTGDFAVQMTGAMFHVGRTNVDYSIVVDGDNCTVTYDLFVNDGYWDVDFIDANTLGKIGLKWFKPDGMGPNLERFGGSPYPYIPVQKKYTFPNPGY